MLSVFLSATLPDYILVCQERTPQNAPSLFVPEPKTLQYPPSLLFEEEVEIFSLYGCEKILPLARLPGQVMFGWLQSLRRWAGRLSDSVPIPSRPSPWPRISQPNMFCPGRQGKWLQSGSRPSYIMDSSP